MDDEYLKIFDNLFFNSENYEQVKSTVNQVNSVLASIIIKYGEIENEISYGISKQDDFIGAVICLFVRKIMEQLDAINVLYSVCSFTQAQVILRSLIENVISLKFILKENTKKRAAAYYLEHHYQELELGEEYFGNNSKYRELFCLNEKKEQYEDGFKRYQKKKEAFGRVINSNEIFQQIDNDRRLKLEQKKNRRNKKKKGSNKKAYIQWYEVCSDISSFYGLMKETGYEIYYQSIYGGLSFEVHALNSTTDMMVNEDGFSLKWIRNPANGGSTFSLACTFSISALEDLYIYLNDGEAEKREFREFLTDYQKKRDIAIQNLDKIKNR